MAGMSRASLPETGNGMYMNPCFSDSSERDSNEQGALHRVAFVRQAGLMDEEGAAEEIAAIEKQLHELVDGLRRSAGVAEEEEEGEPGS